MRPPGWRPPKMPGTASHKRGRAIAIAGLVVVAALALPALALAHLERPSYWPDPAPDKSVSPPAGGEVPDARSLRSAVTGKGPGEVRVVCLGDDARALDSESAPANDADGAQPLGQVTAGSVARMAQCRDWRAGTQPERIATIHDVRSQINLEDAPVEIPALTDDEAYRLFQGACSHGLRTGSGFTSCTPARPATHT